MPRGIEDIDATVHHLVVIKKSYETLGRYGDSLVDFKSAEKTYNDDRI